MRALASLCLTSLLGACLAGPVASLRDGISKAKTPSEFYAVLDQADLSRLPGYLRSTIEGIDQEVDWKDVRSDLVSMIRYFDPLELPEQASALDAKRAAKTIISGQGYKQVKFDADGKEAKAEGKSWGAQLREWLKKLFRESESNSVSPGSAGIKAMEPIVWLALGGGLLAFLTVFLVNFRIRRRKRVGRALLADDEALLSADEWLVKARDLAKNSQEREAVRCLYLASLTRMDEFGWLTFVRTDTNWEHVRRYESAGGNNIDLKRATIEFDRVWYGYDCRPNDFAYFLGFYENLLKQSSKGGTF